jgi:flagellar basal-body rod protein FlgB
MADMGIFDSTVGLLGQVLDLRKQKQEVIASNIANAETPGFAPSKMTFEADLKRALENKGRVIGTTHAAHFPIAGSGGIENVRGRVLRTPDQSGVGDRNGVQTDQELVGLAENEILYEAAVQSLTKKLGLLKYVASDGR